MCTFASHFVRAIRCIHSESFAVSLFSCPLTMRSNVRKVKGQVFFVIKWKKLWTNSRYSFLCSLLSYWQSLLSAAERKASSIIRKESAAARGRKVSMFPGKLYEIHICDSTRFFGWSYLTEKSLFFWFIHAYTLSFPQYTMTMIPRCRNCNMHSKRRPSM